MTCFTSDCFGAPLPTAELASGPDARDVPAEDLRAAQLLWAAVDSPWVHNVNTSDYLKSVRSLQALNPEVVLGTHLPPAAGIGDQLFDMLAAAPTSNPFVGPDQQALEAMLAGFEPGPAPAVVGG